MVFQKLELVVSLEILQENKNDLIYNTMKEFPNEIEGYAFINPKDSDAINEVNLCLDEYKNERRKISFLETRILSR